MGLFNGFSLSSFLLSLIFVCIIGNITENKQKLILAVLFTLTSLLCFLLINLLNISPQVIINYYSLVKLILVITLIIIGVRKLNNFINDHQKEDEKLIKGVKKILHNKRLILTLVGIILLGVFYTIINIYNRPSILGIFNSLLLNNINFLKSIIYVILYTVLYIVANLIIILLLLLIEKLLKIKLSKYIDLINGILLFLVGILLLLKPEWLML